MTEFRFPPFKLPELPEVEARPLAALEGDSVEFRFAPVALAEPGGLEARPLAAREAASVEFRFPPFRLPEPGGLEARPLAAREGASLEFRFPPLRRPESGGCNGAAAAAPTGSCCANCNHGLPCASGAGGVAPHDGGCHAGVPVGGKCACSSQRPTSPSPPGEEAKQPFWRPMDIEVKLRPMFGCKLGEYEWGKGNICNPDWPEEEEEKDDDDTRPPPRPNSHCAPFPPTNTDGWDPNHLRCSINPCKEQTARCAAIAAGMYSAKSRTQPIFSYSKWKDGKLVDGGADCSLIRAIAYHIDMTQAGDEVHIAIAAWWTDGWPILNAVLAAHSRGVTVQVIANTKDVGQKDKPWHRISSTIWKPLEDTIGPENIKYWKNTKSFPNISHNKFVLIRKGNKQHLVLITGANWAPFDVARHCDLLTVDSQPIYHEFLIYWRSLWDGHVDNWEYETEVADPETGITAHFWPVLNEFGEPDPQGSTVDNNPFIQIITKYKAESTTKIRIIAAHWSSSGVGGDLLTTLKGYRESGADVRVIGNHHLDPGCHGSDPCEVQPGDKVFLASCETKNGVWKFLHDHKISWAKCPPHAKVLLISGRKTDNKWHQAVYTGSMNFSYEWGDPIPDMKAGAMPDAFIGVHDDPEIFLQYEKWWNWLCRNTAINRGDYTDDLMNVCGDFEP